MAPGLSCADEGRACPHAWPWRQRPRSLRLVQGAAWASVDASSAEGSDDTRVTLTRAPARIPTRRLIPAPVQEVTTCARVSLPSAGWAGARVGGVPRGWQAEEPMQPGARWGRGRSDGVGGCGMGGWAAGPEGGGPARRLIGERGVGPALCSRIVSGCVSLGPGLPAPGFT
jgi:hypothetical protein